jgi:ketosteroid isomerase-like protein
MKQLIIYTSFILFLFSCKTSEDNNKAENLALANKYMQAVEANDIAAMSNLLADNYKGYGPSDGDSTNKEDAIRNWKYNAENLYESVKYSRHQNIAVTVKEGEEALPGEWVSNWALLTIKYKDGRGPVRAWVNAVYKIENGKIVLSRTFYNEADILRQLGYQFSIPKP